MIPVRITTRIGAVEVWLIGDVTGQRGWEHDIATLGSVTTTTVSSLCAYCGVGCGVISRSAPTQGETAITKSVGTKNHPTNFGRLHKRLDHFRHAERGWQAHLRPRATHPRRTARATDVDTTITDTAAPTARHHRRTRTRLRRVYVRSDVAGGAIPSNKLTKDSIGTKSRSN